MIILTEEGQQFQYLNCCLNRHSRSQWSTLASDGTWSGTKLHLATDSNGINSKMALNGGGSIVGSNTKTLTPGPLTLSIEEMLLTGAQRELFSTMDPQMLQPPLERILCSAYLLSILVTGMTDQPSSVIWMVILQSLLFIQLIFLTMIVSVSKFI